MRHAQAGSYNAALEAARKAASLLPDDTQIAALVQLLTEKVALSDCVSGSESEDAAESHNSSESNSEASSHGVGATSSSDSEDDSGDESCSESGSDVSAAPPVADESASQDAVAERASLLASAAERMQLQNGGGMLKGDAPVQPQIPPPSGQHRSRQQLRAVLQGQLEQLRRAYAGRIRGM